MNSLVFLIPLSVLLVVGAGIALFWAVDRGQFDDMETPGLLPLDDAERSSDDLEGNNPRAIPSENEPGPSR
jgi:cbb3-type cytochrome oxidase maturation protein